MIKDKIELIEGVNAKVCSGINGCNTLKHIDEFGIFKKGKMGRNVFCKECKRTYDRIWIRNKRKQTKIKDSFNRRYNYVHYDR